MRDIIDIAICDDENIQVELLHKYVKNWADKNNLKVKVESFYSAEAFEFNWSMDKKYDILLLDIQMEGIDGIELAKRIRKKDNYLNIIFITAISDYIGEGYDLDAINYLIKPIKEEKLYECLNRSLEKISLEEKAILLESDGEIIRLKQDDIVYIEAFSHYIDLYTKDCKYTSRINIGAIEKELEKNSFIRCHRSYLVGLKHIRKIGKDNLELDNGDIVPVSRRQMKNTHRAFIEYYKGEIDD